ncbi:MAG: hypothetical protein NVV82_01530 [Sporocytophaga sp.]|nr:hypothetical protein [Sporocytophaga sp.]
MFSVLILNIAFMKCLVNDLISSCMEKNKEVDVIDRYLRMKHHIEMDRQSIISRIKAVKHNYNFK